MPDAVGPVDALHTDSRIIEASQSIDIQVEFAGDVSAAQEGRLVAIENRELDTHTRQRCAKILRRAPEVRARDIGQPQCEALAVGLSFISCVVELPVRRT